MPSRPTIPRRITSVQTCFEASHEVEQEKSQIAVIRKYFSEELARSRTLSWLQNRHPVVGIHQKPRLLKITLPHKIIHLFAAGSVARSNSQQPLAGLRGV
jgi:hypothetical protein